MAIGKKVEVRIENGVTQKKCTKCGKWKEAKEVIKWVNGNQVKEE